LISNAAARRAGPGARWSATGGSAPALRVARRRCPHDLARGKTTSVHRDTGEGVVFVKKLFNLRDQVMPISGLGMRR
jgi:hypothetical protein